MAAGVLAMRRWTSRDSGMTVTLARPRLAPAGAERGGADQIDHQFHFLMGVQPLIDAQGPRCRVRHGMTQRRQEVRGRRRIGVEALRR